MHVQDAITVLSSRLIADDRKSAESACLALSRLAESYKNDKNKLREIAEEADVLANLQKVLVTTPANVTFVTVLHILVLMASNGSRVGPMLLEAEIGATLKQLLVANNDNEGKLHIVRCQVSAWSEHTILAELEIIARNPQELFEITNLTSELLPPLPADGIFAVDALLAKPGAYIRDPVLWQWQEDKGDWRTYGYTECRVIEAAFVAGEDEVQLGDSVSASASARPTNLNLKSMHEIIEEKGTARPIQRRLTSQLTSPSSASSAEVDDEDEEKRRKHFEAAAKVTKELLPVLLEVYATSAGPGVRHNCIQVIYIHNDAPCTYKEDS